MTPAAGIVIAALVLTNAWYVAAEFGAVGVRRSRVRRMRDDGHWLAGQLLPHIETPSGLGRYVAASQVGITVSGLALGAYAQATVAVSLAPSLVGVAGLTARDAQSAAEIAVLLALTLVQTVIGELVPKSLSLQFPTEVALATVLPMQWTLRAFQPFIALINLTTRGLLRVLGTKPAAQRHLHSPEEIDLLIAESHDGGLLEADEHQRLHRALRLGLRTTRDLMVPLERLTMVSVDAPWEDTVRRVTASPYSRLPVYRDSPDQIIGTLRVKDLVRRYVTHGPTELRQLLRPVVRVPADLPADKLVGVLRERRAHQAIVIDAADTPVGLITIQNVLEALVGPGAARAQ